jgi:hypothetical protein
MVYCLIGRKIKGHENYLEQKSLEATFTFLKEKRDAEKKIIAIISVVLIGSCCRCC